MYFVLCRNCNYIRWPCIFDCSVSYHIWVILQIFEGTHSLTHRNSLCKFSYGVRQVNRRNEYVRLMSPERAKEFTIVLCCISSISWDAILVRVAIQLIIYPFLEFIVSQPIG